MSRRFATAAIQATFTSNPPRLNAAVILNRSPFLTPTSTPFEAAYYAYQVKLARALSSPFHLPFYFKQGSLLHRRFRAEERQRNFEAWGATGKRKGLEDASDVEQVALSDSVHGSSTSSTPEKPKRAETVDDIPMEDDEFKPTPRESRADVSGDVKSLDRMGDRNLYLLLKTRKDGGVWTFPHGPVDASQPLHLVG
jgi:large subunit ribosomal protein L46